MTDPHPYASTLLVEEMDALHNLADHLVKEAAGLGHYPSADDPDLEAYRQAAAGLVDQIDRLRQKLRDVQDDVAEALVRSYPYDEDQPLTLIDVGRGPWGPVPAMTPRFGGQRTEWDNDRLRAEVRARLVEKALSNEDAWGHPRAIAEEILDRVEEVVTISGSSVKAGRKLKDASKMVGLRGLGLDPDDFCTKTKAPPTVQINRGS